MTPKSLYITLYTNRIQVAKVSLPKIRTNLGGLEARLELVHTLLLFGIDFCQVLVDCFALRTLLNERRLKLVLYAAIFDLLVHARKFSKIIFKSKISLFTICFS